MTVFADLPKNHEETAGQMLAQVRALVASIPRFAHLPAGQRRKLQVSATLPDKFLLSVGVGLDASETLTRASDLSGAELRNIVAFSQSYAAVAAELTLAAKGLRETIDTVRAQAGQAALRAYALAKDINRPREREVLIPHLAEMKRTLGRGNRKPAEPPVQPPVEPPPPAAS